MDDAQPARDWPDILLCILLWSLGGLAGPMLFPVLPEIAQSLGIAPKSALYAVPAFFLGFALSHFLVAFAGRRPSLAGAVLTSLGLYAAASLVAANSAHIEIIVAACFTQGLAYGFLPAAVRMVLCRDRDARTAQRDLSFVAGIVLLVPIASPVVGSALADKWGWGAVFWVQGLTASAIAVPVLLIRSGAFRAERNPGTRGEREASLVAELKMLFHRQDGVQAISQMVLLYGLVMLIQFDIARVVPTLGNHSIHNTSVVIGLSCAFMATGSFLASRFRLNYPAGVAIMLALCLGCFMVEWVSAPSLIRFGAAMCLVSFGAGTTVWAATTRAMMVSADPSLVRSAALGFAQYSGSFAIIGIFGLVAPAAPAAHFLSAALLLSLALGLSILGGMFPDRSADSGTENNPVAKAK